MSEQSATAMADKACGLCNVLVREENGEIILTPIVSAETPKKKESQTKLQLGFVKGPPLPESFFDPLPEEELRAWGL